MFDMKVFQISHTYMRNIGLHVLRTFQSLQHSGLGPGRSRRTECPAADQPTDRLRRHQSGRQSDHLPRYLANCKARQNSIFSQPVATFGGGLTFFGLSLDQLSAAVLTMNDELGSPTRPCESARFPDRKRPLLSWESAIPSSTPAFRPIFQQSGDLAGARESVLYGALSFR